MRFKTRELELSKALDEVFLRLFLIGLRVFEIVVSIPLIGFVAAIISDFSKAEIDYPAKAVAAISISCVCTVYAAITILPIFFEGPMFFTMMAILDALFVAAWSSLIGVWDRDGTGICHAFESKYFGTRPWKSYFSTDCKLVKVMFAFMIINLVAFVTSAIISFCLRMIELDHIMSWRSLPLMNRFENKEQRRHCSCCNHDQYHPSPPSSVSGEPLRASVYS
ncbi:uncharacterized protein Z518_08856 [Rhinocladiella mackenziei CBS 650.93]|uniref:Rhinocladiella mackenziei CBS 650.93 unplaced genomic scaffold supercont1.6, whole genome shotgun sequence n=1 Tax=Rhinocladiella mackenziei CBS 650.93 TaxID=1442369 RepID=A0A0D2GXL4_9EURO|nr:uncharacterized protein Z518_08856 [Rhinocladiella mackenziei CBS 650.93]KIX02913.1 hypothetical protein Z518_08856 [Rhinocladiella mackenziei CBS 650.93]